MACRTASGRWWATALSDRGVPNESLRPCPAQAGGREDGRERTVNDVPLFSRAQRRRSILLRLSSPGLLEGAHARSNTFLDSVAGIPESQVIQCSLDEEFDPLSPSNMLPIGAATAVAPCLLCLPVACPLRSGQFKPTPGRRDGCGRESR